MSSVKVWLITGCSSGFGEELAKAALQRGDRVIATAGNAAKLEGLRDVGAFTIALDFTAGDGTIQRVVDEAVRIGGKIDILVNNAASIFQDGAEEASDGEAKDHFETNVFGQLAVIRAVLPHMRAQRSGVIANFGPVGGWRGAIGGGIYSATKSALVGITEALRLENAHLGIECTIIEPDCFSTNLLSGGSEVDTEKGPDIDLVRERSTANDKKQPGDRAKAAQLLVEVLTKSGRCEGIPLPSKVPLGRDAAGICKGIVEEQAEFPDDTSMALAVLSDPPAQENVNCNTELAIVRVDNTETTSESNDAQELQVGNGFYTPAHGSELSAARESSPGNWPVSPTGVWDGPPRWATSTVGILTVQCARCLKWRVVPSREQYEAIREHILETPWVCENALQWRPVAHCNLPTDLNQDSQSLWAIDKPNLPSSPPGWSRKVVVRRDCSTRFADVYYNSPDGKSLRSMVEVAKYLEQNPGSVPLGTMLSQFSFTSPRPLPGLWVARKRNRPGSIANHSTSQEYKKAKTAQPLVKQLAQKLLHGSTPPLLPVPPSLPSSSALSYPMSLGAMSPVLPSLPSSPLSYPMPLEAVSPAASSGPDLVQVVADQAPNYQAAPNCTDDMDQQLFSPAYPSSRFSSAPRYVDSPNQMPHQAPSFCSQQGTSTSNAESPLPSSAIASLRMKQLQQQKTRFGGEIPRSHNANLPGILPLRDPDGFEVLYRG